MDIVEDGQHLSLQFAPPGRKQADIGRANDEWALMVRLESRQPDDHYRTSDYLFRVTPESAYPVHPVDQAPAEKPIWRPIRQPLTALDLYP
ncbi:hypothetical protein CF392_15565 [Tamilnaduibacter salinus]|uniref:Uncharacterized protein n=1 Tax=Tamilnaduibacter salinus TaxID=1484056 RepID=A0A2A2HZ18_9GAMM|nr:hypothetical protein CF392_15565 [Tamilnaduibacter salinus]